MGISRAAVEMGRREAVKRSGEERRGEEGTV